MEILNSPWDYQEGVILELSNEIKIDVHQYEEQIDIPGKLIPAPNPHPVANLCFI